jgi:hypothetical protein
MADRTKILNVIVVRLPSNMVNLSEEYIFSLVLINPTWAIITHSSDELEYTAISASPFI